MPSSKARNLADLLGGGGAGVPSFSGTGAIDVPAGTTAERPSNPNSGYVRFNTTLGSLEQYNGTVWVSIVGSPFISSLNVTEINENDGTQTIVVTGKNLSNATCVLFDTNGTQRVPTTRTNDSETQITITFSGNDVLTDAALEPFSVEVSSDGGTFRLNDSLNINNTPNWTTASGNIGTVLQGESASFTITAVDPENEAVTYSLTAGALPTGINLNQATGAITGTANISGTPSSGSTAYNFTVTASDGNNSVPQSFNILHEWKLGQSAEAAIAYTEVTNMPSYGLNSGMYYIDLPNVGSTPCFIDNEYDGGGWILVLAGDRAVGDTGASPPRNDVAPYGSGDAFYLGTRGTNLLYNFGGNTLTTSNTERLFANLPFTHMRIAGTTYNQLDNSGRDFAGYYDLPAWEAYKTWSMEMVSSANSTFASKLNNTTSWTRGRNSGFDLSYNRSWSTSYSAGSFKLGFYQVQCPSYGDYVNIWVGGGTAQRKALSASLWRQLAPDVSAPNHDNPTSISMALGKSVHRGGYSYYNDSLWFKNTGS